MGPDNHKFIECTKIQYSTENLGYLDYLTAFTRRPERFADIWIRSHLAGGGEGSLLGGNDWILFPSSLIEAIQAMLDQRRRVLGKWNLREQLNQAV